MKYCWLVFLFLSGCNLGPHLQIPEVDTPAVWKHEDTDTSMEEEPSPSPCLWWQVFQDDTLNELELKAVSLSPDLDTALWKIEESWAIAGLSFSDLLPQINLAPSYTNSGSLIKLFRPPNFNIPFPSDPYRVHQINCNLPLNLSYELDFWGRLRKEYDAGLLDAHAQIEAYQVTLLTLTSEIASHYYTLRTLSEMIEIYQAEAQVYEKNLNYYTSRYEKGIDSSLDISTAQIELSQILASLADTKKQKELEINRLAALIGIAPSDLNLEPTLIAEMPPLIPAGVPSDILLNRPDIAQKERTRAAQNARVGSAWASFFPSFDLMGSLGFFSPTTQDFLGWQSRLWSIGGSMNQTIFDGGRKMSNYKIACARFEQADSDLKSTVITAFREVEDALATLRYEREKYTLYNEARTAAKRAFGLSSRRKDQGLVTSLEVIDKERSFLNASIQSTESLGNTYQATIMLIKALGGSW